MRSVTLVILKPIRDRESGFTKRSESMSDRVVSVLRGNFYAVL